MFMPLLSFILGVLVGVCIGLAIARHLPAAAQQGVSTMRAYVQRHTTMLLVLCLLSNALTVAGFIYYQRCVAGYVRDAGVSQAPRSVASVKAQDKLHDYIETPTPANQAAYLSAYDAYSKVVAENPTPALSWCLHA